MVLEICDGKEPSLETGNCWQVWDSGGGGVHKVGEREVRCRSMEGN